MINLRVRFQHSTELLPFIGRGSPQVGDWVRCQVYAPASTIHVNIVITPDVGRVESIESCPGDSRVSLRDKSNKILGALEIVQDGEEMRCYRRMIEINNDINDLLTDAAAGNFDTSRCRYAEFLRGLSEARRRLAVAAGSVVASIRGSHEAKNEFLLYARIFFSLPRENRPYISEFAMPVVEYVAKQTGTKLQSRRCHEIHPNMVQTIDWSQMVQVVEMQYDDCITGFGGGVVFSRNGPRRPERAPPATTTTTTTRPEAFLRQLAEFTGADRRRIFEALQREFGGGGGGGGGELERRRERSGGRPAAPSAACLCVPPPLLILEGVLHPMPPGMNPLMFPPPINIS